jgi:CheY-like chemotaxis protein
MASRNFQRDSASPSARILLVDDNGDGLSARKSVLEEIGYQIVTATSGAAALEKFAASHCDLVVTDYKMPMMDGKQLIRHLREQAPDLAIIMISGYSDTLGMDEKTTGADVVIQKSSNEVAHLVRSVSRLLKKRKPAKTQMAAKKPPASAASGSPGATRAKS